MNEIDKSIDKFKEIIFDLFSSQIDENENELFIKIKNAKIDDFTIQKDLINSIFSSLDTLDMEGETVLYGDNSYETLISFEDSYRGLPFTGPHIRGQKINKEDSDNKLTYEISVPTDEYLIFILQQIIDKEHGQRIMRPITSRFVERFLEEYGEKGDLLQLIKRAIPKLYTLKITSSSNRSLNQFSDFANSFMFNYAYNLDRSIIEVKFIDNLIRSNRLSKMRRARIDDIDPPRRIYNPDLIYHYQMAVSSDSPLLQFLSYYHIIEHFFNEISNQDLIETLKIKLTDPCFSYRRKKDLMEIVKIIENKRKTQGDGFRYKELNSLLLTLKKYVNFEDIKKQIEKYDITLIDHYKNNSVSFSKGDTVDLNSNSNETYKNLAGRIYETRNAIVHSKEGDKPRYVPFKHDKDLIQEIPLIRFIAEHIIIHNSNLMGEKRITF